MANDVGKMRRSAALTPFGPGAVIDFRAGSAPVSGIAAGLEEWDRSFPPAGLTNQQSIHEVRLQDRLKVHGFRLPPVVNELRGEDDPDTRRLVAARFPQWLQCPDCDTIAPERRWKGDPGRAYRYCALCTNAAPGRKKVFVVPVRFVVACQNGHLADFPWHFWVGHKAGCTHKRDKLKLKANGPGLAGLWLSCPECDASRPMDGCFNRKSLQACRCRGERPWLGDLDGSCTEPIRAMQRGASNLYFPSLDSALSIPPWSDRLQDLLGIYWHPLTTIEPEALEGFIRQLAKGPLKGPLEKLGLASEELSERINRKLHSFNERGDVDLRAEEYRQFTGGPNGTTDRDRDFEIRSETVPEPLQSFVQRLVRVVRLREVRALRGFYRIEPPEVSQDSRMAPISRERQDWLPAIEVRGEGIFIELNREQLSAWETRAVDRAADLHHRWAASVRSRWDGMEPDRVITARFLLIHALAHVLMRQLTLECGYSSASLRERLYVGGGPEQPDQQSMAGLLIYTATADADGTLGGLQRQGESARMLATLESAIRASEWCSSDPLCIEGILARSGNMCNAACHACLMAPETSCEEYNRFLDRAMLVGTPGDAALGYLRLLLKDG